MPIAAAPDHLPRQQLLDVLIFLERRGAGADVLKMAMTRADIHPDVAQLLAQCIASGQLLALDAAIPAVQPELPAPAPTTAASPRDPSRVALGWLARMLVWWGIFVTGGLILGFAVGMDLGINHGIEQGLDRLQLALAGH